MTKKTTSTLLATASLIVLFSALFVPLFCGIALWFVVTISVWELSHILALLCAVAITTIILIPLIRPSARAWLFPFSFGLTIFVSVFGAAFWSFVFPGSANRSNDFSDLFFHPYGLIILVVGGLLCITEGFYVKAWARSVRTIQA